MQQYHYTGGGANRTQEEATKLAAKYDLFDKNLLRDVFHESLGLEVTNIQLPMNSSIPHVTYIVSFRNHPDLFYRGNLGWKEPEVQLLKEKLVADLARKQGVPANNIIYVDVSRKKFPFDFQIQEVITGLDAELGFTGTKEDYDRYSFSLGQNIARLQQTKVAGFGHFIDELLSSGTLQGERTSFYDYMIVELATQIALIEKSGYISTETGNEMNKLFDDAKELMNIPNASTVHYDLADHNLRYDPKTFEVTAVYDWEACIAGDSVLDLASCPTWKTPYPRLEKAVDGFLSEADKPDHFQEKLDLYRLRTIIWKIDHNLKFNIATPERMKRLELALEPFGLHMTHPA